MSSTTDTPAAQVQRMRDFVEKVQQDGQFDLINDYFHPDFFNVTAKPPQAQDLSGVLFIMKYIKAAFEGLQIEMTHCVSDGHVVATNKVFRGKLVGEFLGNEPTGKLSEIVIMDFMTVKEGKFKDHWAALGQLSVIE